MKWSQENICNFDIPDNAKHLLATEGIDASELLYPAEFCDAFHYSDDDCCIGSIVEKAVIIGKNGAILLCDNDDTCEVVATSVSQFVAINSYLANLDYDSELDWDLVLLRMSNLDECTSNSNFWKELVDYLKSFF